MVKSVSVEVVNGVVMQLDSLIDRTYDELLDGEDVWDILQRMKDTLRKLAPTIEIKDYEF